MVVSVVLDRTVCWGSDTKAVADHGLGLRWVSRWRVNNCHWGSDVVVSGADMTGEECW